MRTDPADARTETLGGRRVLTLMAARAEYGGELAARIDPLLTGVGPVEAALAAGIALRSLAARDALPEVVICLGSAGSRVLEQGRIYQAASVSWRDIDASPLGFPKGITPFLDQPAEIPLLTPLADMPVARLSTGGNIVTGAAYDAIDAEMVDMETFAVARACQRFGLPLIGLRGISDGAEELRHYTDWTTLLDDIDTRLAAAIDDLAAAFAA